MMGSFTADGESFTDDEKSFTDGGESFMDDGESFTGAGDSSTDNGCVLPEVETVFYRAAESSLDEEGDCTIICLLTFSKPPLVLPLFITSISIHRTLPNQNTGLCRIKSQAALAKAAVSIA